MNFLRIAQRACDRREYVRAVITLSRGLKRQDVFDEQAFDLLINTYANFCSSPGVEREVAEVVARHFDAGYIAGQIIARFHDRDRRGMAHAFRRAIESFGVIVESVSLPEAPTFDTVPDLTEADLTEVDDSIESPLWAAPADRDTLPNLPAVTPDQTIAHHEQDDSSEVGATDPPSSTEVAASPPASASEDDADEAAFDAAAEDVRAPEGDDRTQGDDEAPSPAPEMPAPEGAEASDEGAGEPDAPAPAMRTLKAHRPMPAVPTEPLSIHVEITSGVELDAPDAQEEHAPTPPKEAREPAQQDTLHEEDDTGGDAIESPAPRQSTEERVRSERRWWRVATILSIVVVVGTIAWMSLATGSKTDGLDRQLLRFDPLHPEAFETTLKRSNADRTSVAERADFIDALLALEEGGMSEPLPEAHVDALGVWGLAARAMEAMQRRDFEESLFYVSAMERLHPRALATMWCRARHEEERGQMRAAKRAYEEALEHYASFLPGMMGSLRVAYRTGDALQVERVAARLRQVSPLHPYLKVTERAPVEVASDYLTLTQQNKLLGGALADAASKDRFLQAYQRTYTARRAWHEGDMHTARKALKEALMIEPHMGPALLLQGVLSIDATRLQDAMDAFARVGSMEGSHVSLRLALMRIAPRALTQAGRPDLGWVFALNVPEATIWEDVRATIPKDLDQTVSAHRPEAMTLAREQLDAHLSSAEAAHYELARTLWLWGRVDDALAALDALEERGALSPDVRLLEVLCHFGRGDAERLSAAAHHLRSQPHESAARAVAKILAGDWEGARRLSSAGSELLRRHPFWLRAHVLTLLMRGRAEDVLVTLDELRITSTYRPSIQRLEMRAWAMLGRGAERRGKLLERAIVMEPTAPHAMLDIAATLFWSGDLSKAREWVDRAHEAAPRHPEVHWYKGVLATHEGRTRAARDHLIMAGREGPDDPVVLVTLGEVYLRVGRNKSARQMFYKAVLRDKKNLRAIRGLGRASAAVNTDVSERDLQRMLLTYVDRPGYKAQAGELLKWLAIYHGSRRGVQEALPYLDRAIDEAGARADLLLEKGMYYAARGEHDAAAQMFVRALRRNSTLAGGHLGLAKLALRAGESSSARDHLTKYIELKPYGEDVAWARKTLAEL